MRKILISLLLASSVATPAVAAGPSRDDRATAREERQAAREESRSERTQSRSEDRSSRAAPSFQAPERNFAPARSTDVRPNRDSAPQPQQWSRPDRTDRGPAAQQWSRPDRNLTQSRPDRQPNSGDTVATWRQDQRDQVREQREVRVDRQGSRAPIRVTPPTYARPDRPAPIPETASHYDRSRTPQWSTQWHNDRQHHDWRNYRNHHRSLFQLGFYFDPFGWNYQRFGIGWRMWPSYYDQSYWLQDPYMYDLPYAPWPYRWVRYYDDAVLVNIFTGQVQDVVYDFFW